MRVKPPEPVLTWIDSRGYNLSDRIWNVSELTASQIDLFLQEGIAQGVSSLTLAKTLEQFLLPGRALPRTDRPYGTDASFNALRLARSEITRAFSVATKTAGMLNPFVDRAYWNLSGSHPEIDECDGFAEESDANNGYAPEDVPVPGDDSHPQCLCFLTHSTISESDFLDLFDDNGDLPPDVQEALNLFDNWQQLLLLLLGLLPLVWDDFFG
jgi:hypothetical protein